MAKQATPQGRDNFQNMRFGMFIHWGVYSLLARGEWVMHIESIPVPEYEKLPPQFNPHKFDANAWVSVAADAGQKYMVITSRHHDGFSMFDTALSDYKITNTPFKRDPIAELANACARRGDVKLGIYQSLLDWHHPAYRFRKESGLAWSDYLAFLHGQVREVCTNYGEVVSLWFDGDWPAQPLNDGNAHFAPGGSFEYETLYDLIHTLQPGCAIHNNRHVQPLPGEDVQGFEQDLPGENSAGFNYAAATDMPAEVCMTMNTTWGYNAGDHDHKSTQTLVNKLVRSAATGANYLLNVGPTAEGLIQSAHAQRLREIGQWLNVNGASIYGTRAGVFSSGVIPPWYAPNGGTFVPSGEAVSTRAGDVHYLHLLNYASDVTTFKDMTGAVALNTLKATLLRDGSPVQTAPGADGSLIVVVPPEQRDRFDTVVRLA